MFEQEPPCVFCNRSAGGLSPLVEFWPVPWDGASDLSVCEVCLAALREVMAGAAALRHEPPQCLDLLAGAVAHELVGLAGDKSRWLRELRHLAAAERDAARRLAWRLGDPIPGRDPRRRPSKFREACGCSTCRQLRDPGGWRAFLPDQLADDGGAQLPPSQRPRVDLSEIDPGFRLQFARTLNRDQFVNDEWGEVMKASDYVRTVKFKLANGRENTQQAGSAITENRSDTRFPGIGALAQLSIPRRSAYQGGHDWQAWRRRQNPALSWDGLVQVPPASYGGGAVDAR